MNRRLAYGLTATLALGCGSAAERSADRTTQPIINGADSMTGQFPTVVGLLLDAVTIDPMNPLAGKCIKGTGACTGTMIREDVILTAAHCVSNLVKMLPDPSCQVDPDPPKFTFEVDLIGAFRGGRVRATAKAVAHTMFSPTMCTNPPDVSQWNDIALVFLTGSIKGAPVQRLATPADAGTLLKEGSKVRIVGYGKSKVDDAMGMTAGAQRWGTATLAKVGPSEIQAGQVGEQQACQGDSGGPVFANPEGPPDKLVQIGVASRLRTMRCPNILDIFNPPKCENGVFYTRVDAYGDWIKDLLDKNPQAPAETADMRPAEKPDLASPVEPDLASPEDLGPGPGPDPEPDPDGCKCNVGGRPGAPMTLPLLLFGLVAARLLRRSRRE